MMTDDDHGRDLDGRLHRLLTDRADGVHTEPDLHRVLADGADARRAPERTRLAYLGAMAAAAVVVIAGVGLVGLVGDATDPASTNVPADAPTHAEVSGSAAPRCIRAACAVRFEVRSRASPASLLIRPPPRRRPTIP